MSLKILHIDSSPRGAASVSRRMTAEFVAELRKKHADATVIYHDLGHQPPPFVNEQWVFASQAAEADSTAEQRAELSYSDAAIDELLNADVIVIGSPMHNFSISAALKAFIDQIIRVRRTFVFSDDGTPRGLVPEGKKLFIFTARGGAGYEAGEPFAQVNHQDNYLRDIFGFIGITDAQVIHLNQTMFGEEAVAAATGTARTQFQNYLAG